MTDLSEYLEKKYRMFFRYLDRNKDGILYRKDILARIDKMASLNVANEEESQYTRQCWMRWCNKAFPMIDAEKGVTEDGFIDIWRYFRANNLVVEINRAIYDVLFDRLDANRDGHVSRDELKTYYQALGKADDSFMDRLFRKLDENQDGLVSKEEFIKAGLAFWTSEDVNSGYEIMYDVN